MNTRIYFALPLLVSSFYLAKAHAGGLMLYEIGTDDIGLAAAGYSARAQDPSTIYTNPAGMVRLAGNQTLVGIQVLYEDIEYSPITNSTFLGTQNGGNPIGLFPGGSLFYNHSVSDALKVGLGIYGNLGLSLKYDADWIARYYNVSSTLLGLSIQPSIAYQFNPIFSLGGGLILMNGYMKNKTAINNTPFQLQMMPDGELKLSDDTWGVGINVGFMFQFSEQSRLGITYTSPIKLDFSSSAQFSGLSPILDGVLQQGGLLDADVNFGIEVPQGVMGSFYQEWNDKWAWLMSVGWQNWKKFGQIAIGIDSTHPVNFTTDLHFKNTWHVALGLQHHYSERVLLNAGAGYDSDFQRSNAIPVSIPANDAWRFGVGTRYAYRKDLDVGLSFEYVAGGTLDVNNKSFVRGDVSGQFKDVNAYFLSANANWKCI